MNPKDSALLIFTKNLIPGRVKTRLAATIGDEKALEIYGALIKHTCSITRSLEIDKYVYYSDYVKSADIWFDGYLKKVQQGKNLGERMSNAFAETFCNGYKKAVIIGTDCPDISEANIQNALDYLDSYDIVIGPAADGGYYLLGMKTFYGELFEDIVWSTPTVLNDTLTCCGQSHLSYFLLPVLNDIDDENDLVNSGFIEV